MDINELRDQIDQVDQSIVALFSRRMAISGEIARYKHEHHLPIYIESREAEVLDSVSKLADPELKPYVLQLYRQILTLSKEYQNSCITADSLVSSSSEDEVI